MLPLRDLVRAPGRTVLTSLGVAASITVLVAVLGMMDSFLAIIDRASSQMGGDVGAVTVDLARPAATDASIVSTLASGRGVARASSSLVVVGETVAAGSDREAVPLVIELVDMTRTDIWLPTVERGRLPRSGELLLADKAARDLGVRIGESVIVRHARIAADGSSQLATTTFVISGIHGNPLRALAYLDQSDDDAFGLRGQINQVRLEPAAGTTPADLQRLAFAQPGVRAARSVRAASDQIREGIDKYLSLLRVIEAVPLGLALLVAFNASLLDAEEHRRDHATMFAFGVSQRRVVGLLMVGSFVLAIIGTVLGLAGGWAMARWIMERVVPATLPEIGIRTYLSTTSLITSALLGVVAVTLAPLLVWRRLRRLDVPATLRVME